MNKKAYYDSNGNVCKKHVYKFIPVMTKRTKTNVLMCKWCGKPKKVGV